MTAPAVRAATEWLAYSKEPALLRVQVLGLAEGLHGRELCNRLTRAELKVAVLAPAPCDAGQGPPDDESDLNGKPPLTWVGGASNGVTPGPSPRPPGRG